ncbi:choice-of-anchor tandem repeat GloVer-containing protein [Lentimicrobium sp. S6]|uniref:choice-of-anchor tandem repeat GloVer-containing protein n=1 Tax=Lentimicrobium sp. S6 TaxID=2735872 RepID=UPI001554D18A|nr:choice-of-anchor tandem repeat GloVer-containing protein [Lentimicrobium sp. S6]NPD45909.1 T9SS type A sorting domain-containing protein [Lentimicrobium sp. S6]
MKRIAFLICILFIPVIFSYAQEEIWGYHSLAGSEGGGMIFTVDPENKEVETIHRFGHGYIEYDAPTNPIFFENGNGLLYGSIEEQLYSYNPSSQEIIVLLDSLDFGKLVAIDEDYIYATRLGDTVVDVFAYDIQNNTQEWLLAIPKSQGYEHKGYWTKLDNGKFYTLTRYGGLEGSGALIEIDVENASSRKSIDFGEAKNPEGSLKVHANGFTYGTTVNGGGNGDGVVFKLDPKGDSYIIEASFSNETGRKPKGEMFKASDGNFYGVTAYGGEHSGGTIYKFNPLTSSIQALYHISAYSSEFLNHEFDGYFTQLTDYKLIGVLKNRDEQGKGKIFSFNLLTRVLEVLVDFNDLDASIPYGKIHASEGRFLGLFQGFQNHQWGGIYNYDPIHKEIDVLKMFGRNESAIEGQNPNWMCQGEDGHIYGMTGYGGKENKGILFQIDQNSHEFTKKLDLAEIGFDINPYANGFSVGSGKIIGISTVSTSKETKDSRGAFVFEYDYMQNRLKKIYDIDLLYFGNSEPKMNSNGNIYFNRFFNFYEYNYYKNEMIESQVPDLEYVRDLIEYLPNVYVGSCSDGGTATDDWTYGMLFTWNKETNEVNRIFDMNRFFPTNSNPATPRNNLFCASNGLVYGDFMSNEVKISWEEPYAYDIHKDSLLDSSPFSTEINNYTRNSVIEDFSNRYLIQNRRRSGTEIGDIGIYDAHLGDQVFIILEESPFYYEYWEDDIEETNAPFDFISRVNLIRTEEKDDKYYWTGEKDTVWYNESNWYGSKTPESKANIVITPSAPRFPWIDTIVDIGSLEIMAETKLTLSPQGQLTCESIIDKGDFLLLANDENKASFILENGEEQKGGFTYQYQSSKAQIDYMGLPIKESTWFHLDSITAFGYEEGDDEYFLPIEDSSYLFQAMNPYILDLDSGQVIHFKGESNWGDMHYTFHENRFYSLANPYPSSFNWSQLDFTHLSHPALYRFNMEEDQFETYIDGLGDAHPLIQPLDVFWVYAEQNEQMDFLNADRIHASGFQENLNIRDHVLKLKVDSKNGSDYTYISFNPSSSPDFEYDKDALKIMPHRNNRPQIFTYGGEKELGINQLPDTTMMDLSVKCQSNGTFTISIDSNMGYDYLILEDLIWNKRINLLEESYTFDYFTSDGNYPFKLYFTDWVLQPVEEGDIEVYYYPESIVVRSRKMIKQADIIFYDLAGKAVMTYTENDFFKFEKAISLPTGHYIVQVRTDDVVKNTKVLIRR